MSILSRLAALMPKGPLKPLAGEAAAGPTLVRGPARGEGSFARFDAGTWAFIVERTEEELAALRKKNDDPKLTELETAVLRGRIKELKRLLALPERVKQEREATLAEKDAPNPDED